MAEPADAELDVVVVNYNAGQALVRCLDSVFAAARDMRLRVFVVDNRSTDGSARMAKGSHPEITLIENHENVGFGSAANQGIDAGSAPWIFALNPDAAISHGTFREFLALADRSPRVGAIGVLVRDPDGVIYPSARKIPTFAEAAGHALLGPLLRDNRFSRAYTMDDWDRTSEREVDWVSGSCMFLRRSVIELVGGFDPRFFMYAEDADLCTRIRGARFKVLFAPVMEVVHDRGLSTRGSKRMIWEHSRSIYRYFEKHHAKGWRRVLLPPARLVLWIRAKVVSRRMWLP